MRSIVGSEFAKICLFSVVGLFTCQQNKRRILLRALHGGRHEEPLCKTFYLFQSVIIMSVNARKEHV